MMIMKALIVLVILLTVAVIFFQYKRNKDLKKLLITLITFAVLISLGVVGNMTRPVMPIFLAHIILLIIALGGLMLYIFKERYYWWVIFSPVITIGLFLVLEFLAGSGNEVM